MLRYDPDDRKALVMGMVLTDKGQQLLIKASRSEQRKGITPDLWSHAMWPAPCLPNTSFRGTVRPRGSNCDQSFQIIICLLPKAGSVAQLPDGALFEVVPG